MGPRRDLILAILIAAAAFALRLYTPWSAVFENGTTNFLETDSWYHVRLIENQVRNWPWRLTVDPYAAAGGQFVPIAPLFDTIVATAARVVHGREATTLQVERVAALAPPVFGALTVFLVWLLAARAFDRRAGLIAAALLAILPGHFLDRTLLGFVDHHALEVLLAIATLYAIAVALDAQPLPVRLAPGVMLGLYLLGWGSGAFLVFILAVWLFALVPLSRDAATLGNAARVFGTTALVAFILVVVFQDPNMYRYGSQIVALIGLAGLALAIEAVRRGRPQLPSNWLIGSGVVVVLVLAAAVVWGFAPGLFQQLLIDVARLRPDPARMGVLEARPLFRYTGAVEWTQPWTFFRTGFYVGGIGTVFLALRALRERRPMDIGIAVFAAICFAATIGQNRFGYYLVPASALVGGWLATRILDWGVAPHRDNPKGRRRRRPMPLQREIAAVAVAGGMFAPNLTPGLLTATRTGSLPAFWRDALAWVRDHTPPPFAAASTRGVDPYLQRYSGDAIPVPDYTVMNWWDHGYWMVQVARRVPVSNPTQVRAPNAARFYASTTEQEALEILRAERSRYVIADWELPFRPTAGGTIMGRFQNVVDWAGGRHARYYEIYYLRQNNAWTPVWVFHQPYYESMTYRLMALGGQGAAPQNASTVVRFGERVDDKGLRFREVLSVDTYATYEAARIAASRHRAAEAAVVGLDPWRTAFPLEPLKSMVEVHASRTSEQKETETPWVRVFEVRTP